VSRTSYENDNTLADSVVVVTGGGRGIGAATAIRAAEAGATVAIGYLEREDAASAIVGEIRATGAVAEAIQADVSKPAGARHLVSVAENLFGKVDGLVNCAGIMPASPFLEMDNDEWDSVLATNLSGPFYCSQAVLPGMVSRGSGSIVMIASRLGQIGWPSLAHYSASKAGLLGLTKSLAREFGPAGIRVNAVSPGFTVTDMTRHIVDTEDGRRRLDELPSPSFPEPRDVASAVVFLLSDASSAFYGQTLNPNGGGYMP
jgi:3-oxoacyl-[acyl-carrier protein] reductase